MASSPIASDVGDARRLIAEDALPPLDYHQFDFKKTTNVAPSCKLIEAKDVDFTLVTQLSPARLWLMKHHCSRWGEHPISLAVGTKTSKKTIVKALEALGCDTGRIIVSTVSDFDSDEEYPVNRLRNVALAAIRTSHAVFIDADFILSNNAYSKLIDHKEILVDRKTALVIPAFELRPLCAHSSSDVDCKSIHEGILPKNKKDVLDFFTAPALEPTIAQFDSKNNVVGHGSTRYMDWINQAPGDLLPIECITSPRYEPYVVIRYCKDLPPFQEAFTGYGQNKLTWFQHVTRTGYRLFQVGDTFVVHFPHEKSTSFKTWARERNETGDKTSVKVNRIAASFRRWMEDSVPDQRALSQC